MIDQFKSSSIGVICGGRSPEREISLRSGAGAAAALQRLGYRATMLDPCDGPIADQCDVAFITLHGRGGEDGAIQGYCETQELPYTGSGILASAIGMSKSMTKHMLSLASLPVPRTHSLDHVERINEPVVVKPVLEGSSLGVTIVHDLQALPDIYAQTQDLYGDCLIESYIEGIEVSVGVLDIDGTITALPVLELRPKRAFYDYEAKYTPGLTEFIIPADLSESITAQCHQLAINAFHVIGCRGYARIDMMVGSSGPVILEINTNPGLTETSDLPAQALAAGIGYDALIDHMLASALSE